ncbi:hypothetical protein HNP46_000095 [Pseudomonas nitritireducens]|uniref:Uncharacterized protein n=1 Tax=Pseudomonas nitroreducens TaxID=46680 RepID=A0A7W7KEC8_PSENT|nr:hypothetical protein [Pseudomonas nitritireducens]MBB4861284.1 hypothetical protein [Pseudomonas nitritireducens]
MKSDSKESIPAQGELENEDLKSLESFSENIDKSCEMIDNFFKEEAVSAASENGAG